MFLLRDKEKPPVRFCPAQWNTDLGWKNRMEKLEFPEWKRNLGPWSACLPGTRKFPKYIVSLTSQSCLIKKGLMELTYFTDEKVEAQSHADTL